MDLPAIRRELCRVVPEPEDIRRVCSDAIGESVEHISSVVDWQGSGRQVWERALQAFKARTGAIEAIIRVVRDDYPDAFADGIPQRVQPAPPPGAPSVAIVGVVAELGATLDAIANRLADFPGLAITVVDAASEEAPTADFVLVVLGARTGGTRCLADAIGGADLVLLWQGARLEKAPPEEAVAALTLRRHEGALDFDVPRRAAELAVEAVHPFWQARRPAEQAAEDAEDPPRLHAWERAWLNHRSEQWRVGRHGPLAARARRQNIERASIYVPLHAEPLDAFFLDHDFVDEDAFLDGGPLDGESRRVLHLPDTVGGTSLDGMADGWQRSATVSATPRRGADRDERRPAPLERVLSAAELPHLVIEGAPGAGKTVLFQHVAHTLAALHLDEPPPSHQLDLDAMRGGSLRWPIPLLIEAAAIARCAGAGDLIDRLAAIVGTTIDQPVPLDALRAGLARGRYLVLIDALDEVGGQDARDRLAQALAGWARQPDQRTRFVLTTRPSAWRGSTAFPRPLRLIRAARMSPAEADALVERWCAAQGFYSAWSTEACAALAELAARRGGMDPRENPLLLVCALILYGEHRKLPESPVGLYDRILGILCESRRGEDSEVVLRQSLEALFLGLQEAGGARTAIPVTEAARRLHGALPDRFLTVDAARDALDRLYEHTGLLQFEEAGRHQLLVRAWHRSFQEYFAARAIADCGDAVEKTTERLVDEGWAADPEWEGVMRFVAGLHANRTDCARRHVETLHRRAQGHPRRGRLLGLAATALREYREAFPGHSLYRTLPAEVIAAFEADGAGWPLADRLLALNAVGGLGDPRLARPMFVAIDGGEFTMGGDHGAYSSAPARRVRIGRLLAGWRPVAVADFEHFVDVGWADDRWWTMGRGAQDGARPDDWLVQRHHPSRPVTGVSWFAARAFCRWATESGWAAERWDAPTDGVVDLPSEAEWEWLARGSDGRIFPWGDDPPGDGDAARAAYSPGRIGEGELLLDGPAPVGTFPAGSRGPLVDLVGNVWEWCLDRWRASGDPSWPTSPADCAPYGVSMSGVRVVRGGSWIYPSQGLRAARRGWLDPQGRGLDLGFRLVCRVSREHG